MFEKFFNKYKFYGEKLTRKKVEADDIITYGMVSENDEGNFIGFYLEFEPNTSDKPGAFNYLGKCSVYVKDSEDEFVRYVTAFLFASRFKLLKNTFWNDITEDDLKKLRETILTKVALNIYG